MQDYNINDSSEISYRARRIAHWDHLAGRQRSYGKWAYYYRRRLKEIYRSIIPEGSRVLEIGCAQGELLDALKTSRGVGIDFSKEMIARARAKFPHLEFIECDAHTYAVEEVFDYIILSDVVNDLWDVQKVFAQLRKNCIPSTRVVMNYYSRVWGVPLGYAQRMGLAQPLLPQNWLTTEDLGQIASFCDYEVIRHWQEILWPFRTPIFSSLCNRFLAKLWPFNHLALTNILVIRPCLKPISENRNPSVSVVISVRNEAGNIAPTLARMPQMGQGTEVIFVEGHSTDDTYAVIEREIARYPYLKCKLLKQEGAGKADAVRLGFDHAEGEFFMVHDGDMTVVPEELMRFYQLLASGKAEFINGVRFVYPMQGKAMRFCNFIGNKFFGIIFSWLLGQHIRDTLCANKALSRKNYLKVVLQRSYFGDFDPFGDFDLLFGAVKLNLKISDVPVRYRERTYGSTKISRWRNGLTLLKMAVFAARRLKFI